MNPPTSPEQIDRWLSVPTETQHIEFKEAKNTFGKDKVERYCVALANEGGGKLVLGVTDQRPRHIVGTAAFQNPVKAAEDLLNALGFRVDVEEVLHPDGRVVVFHIPSRPRGSAYHREGAYLMRAGEALVPMSEDQLRRIFDEGKPDWLDGDAATNLDAQTVVDRLDTQKYFELLKLPYPTTRESVIDRLVADRLVRQSSLGYAIRRLGAITLARTLDHFPDLSRKATRIVVYSGTSKLETRLDQTWASGYAAGFQDLVRFVAAQLPQNEIIEDALRKEMKLVPDVVLRELVANALIHQDFTMGGASVMIEVYSDRVEISNPGDPVVPVDRFIDGYRSRNEHLADLMRRLHICEEKSSGIDRVIEAVEVFQLPAPDFHAGVGRTIVRIFGPRSFDAMDRADRIRATYQHCALRWVMNERMTNTSLRERFGLPESKSVTMSQVIGATIEAGLIKLDERVGSSKKLARYLPFWA